MSRGIEFINSELMRGIDSVAARLMLAGFHMSRAALSASLRVEASPNLPSDFSTLYEQKRVGQCDELFTIQKLHTLVPGTLLPVNGLAAWFRKLGVDELAQGKNILDGDMSFFGWRSIVQSEYETVGTDLEKYAPALLDDWQGIIFNTKPGVISSYGLYHRRHPVHGPEESIMRARMDVTDVENASLRHYAGIIRRYIRAASTNGLEAAA